MFDTTEIHGAVTQLHRGRVADLATLLNLMETDHVDGPWTHTGQVVTGLSGLRVMFDGDDVAVICPALFSARLAPRGTRRAQAVIRVDAQTVTLDDLAVYVRGVDASIRAERERYEREPEPVTDGASVRDNATAAAMEITTRRARSMGLIVAAGEGRERVTFLPLVA